jgi:Flp pilus assembly pilin Flp
MMFIKKLLSDERGAGTIEYALIATLISIAAITAMVNLGDAVGERYSGVDTAVAAAM